MVAACCDERCDGNHRLVELPAREGAASLIAMDEFAVIDEAAIKASVLKAGNP
jgi:hypothetical protein